MLPLYKNEIAFLPSITEQRKRKGVCIGGRNVGSVNLYYIIREVFLQEGFEFTFLLLGQNSECISEGDKVSYVVEGKSN